MQASRALVLFLMSCGSVHDPSIAGPDAPPAPTPATDLARAYPPAAPAPMPPPPAREDAPKASPRLAEHSLPTDIPTKVDGYFGVHGSRRVHVQLDRPMYRPGETVWFKSWAVQTDDFALEDHGWITYELVDPRGQVVQTKEVQSSDGRAHNDFVIAADAPGGKWTLKATLPTGAVDERPFVVSSYIPPQIAKTLDFIREAYGPGDRVEALVELTRPDGRPLANHPVRALLQAGGEAIAEVSLQTDETGAVFVSTQLPEALSTSDGLLTVFVEDGGITESISRSVPIVLADVQLAFFPEGGHLVDDIPGRVYFEATNAFGQPADVQGIILDDQGQKVSDFGSLHDGLGRFAFTPETGRRYTARVTAPAGIDTPIPLPAARADGCVLRSFDDMRSEADHTAVSVRCSQTQDVLVAGVFREQAVDAAAVSAGPNADTVVHLGLGSRTGAQGVLRVTVFDAQSNPLAERLVYRGAGRDLGIALETSRETYGPRDEVVLKVTTTDPDGTPVAAEVALSVVDDAVVQLADDEEGHILSRLYLEPELLDSPDDPAWYFDPDEALAAHGLDLVLGTKGHRSFEWVQVWNPPPPPPPPQQPQAVLDRIAAMRDLGGQGVAHGAGGLAGDLGSIGARAGLRRGPKPKARAAEAPEAKPAAPAPAPPPPPKPAVAPAPEAVVRARAAERDANARIHALGAADGRVMENFFGNGWATVRVFPAPDYSAGFQGVRTDFRDTVHWAPKVQTNAMGEAELRFFLSDALTNFRVVAEGIGGSIAGRGETTLSSSLPVSVATRMPPAVSAGDTLMLPISVRNSRPQTVQASVSASFDSPLLIAKETSGSLSLTAGSGGTHWVPLEIGEGADSATITLSASGGGLTDTMTQTLEVVPPGFPRAFSAAGDMLDEVRMTVVVDETVPGSLQANVTWQPSTVSSLVQGMEALIQTPGGCFEQTSSTNWPNVAILSYLEAHDGDPRLRQKSAQALEVGYSKLTGYQVEAGGFETWGTGPGKEVLSAFGLLQFADMAKVYPVDAAILQRDVAYLLDQRDGQGGFRNTGQSAHGYGSAPKPILDGFITYALAQTGHVPKLDREVKQQAKIAAESDDPYVLALATRVLTAADHPSARKARKRLAAMQAKDGSFPGAESSITRSYEANLLVESTALAALALMDDLTFRSEADLAMAWLVDNRRGTGSWGATQATALALDALTTHAELNKRPRTDGVVEVQVNGQVVGTMQYTANHPGALVVDGWEEVLQPGENSVVLRQVDGEPLPFTVNVSWRSLTPTSHPGAELTLSTELASEALSMGDTVRLWATVGNATESVVPSPIARIGLPAGLQPQPWQLDELKERGEIAFYELRPREVTLYWDGIHADEQHRVALDLVAEVPGRFTAPASSAYPYYDDDEPAWVAGSQVQIAP